jgi:two-component system sensor histidine kinase CpxA
MNLFFKIFLWFLAAIALMIGVVIFLNWSVQTEPVVSRWQNSVKNQMNVFAATATQVYDGQGEQGLREFLSRIDTADTVSEVDVVNRDGQNWVSDGIDLPQYQPLIDSTFLTGQVQIEQNSPDTALAAMTFDTKNPNGVGRSQHALIVRWERPKPTPMFGESRLRYLRYFGLLLTALLVCYLLALYLSSPIGKIRAATQKLAAGDLSTRVADELGNRHDELGALAADFDLMAERIESLITSQKRLSRDISHELRSPLARLGVALEIAKQKSRDETTPLLDRIETESARLNEMISRLLTLSRLESGSQNIQKQDIDLKGLVEDVAEDADFEAQAKGKSVRFTGTRPCRVMGDEGLLRSAVENVLRNAVRYTAEGTSVDVSLTSDEGTATIKVLDHGGGVPEDELKNVFRPFYRIGEARERATGGIGLGLSIAERAIHAHNGTIEARNVDHGLLVEIDLTCSPKNQAEN